MFSIHHARLFLSVAVLALGIAAVAVFSSGVVGSPGQVDRAHAAPSAATLFLAMDDFSSGSQQPVIPVAGSAPLVNVQKGDSIIGGYRKTNFLTRTPVHTPARQSLMEISEEEGLLYVENGVSGKHRLGVTYGVDENGEFAPLDLDLSPIFSTGRFTLNFASMDFQNRVNFNIVGFKLGTAHRVQGSVNLKTGVGPFTRDLYFRDFKVSTRPGESARAEDFADLDLIVFIFQSAGEGGEDYAIDSIEINY